MFYIRENGIPQKLDLSDPTDLDRLVAWEKEQKEARAAGRNPNRIALSEIPASGGHVKISTVFLNADHNLSHSGPPVLWETMIFWPEHDLDEWTERYTSEADAKAGHEVAVALVKEAIR